MRVVIQNGEYGLVNNGDLAMLKVTLDRLSAAWPGAQLGLLTTAPLLLAARHPGVEPISPTGPGDWPSGCAATSLGGSVGMSAAGALSSAAMAVRQRPRQWLTRARRAIPATLPPLPAAPARPAAVRSASLVLAMGGGYVTDVDTEQATRTLDLLEAAVDHGVPTAMIGQGLGPLDDPELRRRASAVLPRVGVIALREARSGPRLLSELGVHPDRIIVTGDDAIELARGVRSDVLGDGLGVCLRIADYSPVSAPTRSAVRDAIHSVAREHGAPLVPLIISEYRSEDRRSTLPLVEGYDRVVPPLPRYVTPDRVAATVGRCRVLVTGAYHLAVFALSQGIPVVGLSSSRYYDDKLYGLAEMFGGGLTVLRLDDRGLEGRLCAAIRAAWDSAATDRGRLRAAADRQVEAGRGAFAHIVRLVDHTATER